MFATLPVCIFVNIVSSKYCAEAQMLIVAFMHVVKESRRSLICVQRLLQLGPGPRQ